MSTVARELITLLRYEIDDSALRKFEKLRPRGGKVPVMPGGAPGSLPAPNVPGMPTPATMDRTTTAMGRLVGVMRGFLAGMGVAALTKMSDEFAGVEGRVGLVTASMDEQRQALGSLMDVAQATGQKYESVAGLFVAVQRNAKELNLGLDQTLALSKTIGEALTIGGGSAASQQAALQQLQQGLGAGKLGGEELNSVLEQAPRLAQAIADAFKVPVGGLKKLAEAGKLTSKEVAKGLLAQSEKLAAEFERMPKTFSRSMTMLSNKLGEVVYKLSKATRAAELFFKATSVVVANFEDLVKAGASLAAAVFLTKLTRVATALGSAAGLLRKALTALPFMKSLARMLTVATAIYYVFDDIGVWLQGGDSLLTDIIGPMSEWKWLVDAIGAGLASIKDALGGGASTLGDWVSKWGTVGVIVAGIVLAIGTIPALVFTIITAWASVFSYVKKNWDGLINDTIYNVKRLAKALRDLVPQGVRDFFDSPAGPGAAGYASSPVIGPGGAAFGITPAMMNRRSSGAGSSVVNNVSTTVNATTPQPAAVADAAARGTQRGMGALAVPMVEAGP